MSYAEIIASLMLFGSGMLTVERGIFWIVETDKSMFDSHLYVTLSQAMPLIAWGDIIHIKRYVCHTCKLAASKTEHKQ